MRDFHFFYNTKAELWNTAPERQHTHLPKGCTRRDAPERGRPTGDKLTATSEKQSGGLVPGLLSPAATVRRTHVMDGKGGKIFNVNIV